MDTQFAISIQLVVTSIIDNLEIGRAFKWRVKLPADHQVS